jgi:hypothetical protein
MRDRISCRDFLGLTFCDKADDGYKLIRGYGVTDAEVAEEAK